TQGEVIWRYLRLFLVPVHQNLYPAVAWVRDVSSPRAWAALLGLAALGFAGLRARRRAPVAAYATAWFFLGLAPSSALPLSEAMAEHRVYEASGAFFVLAAFAIAAAAAKLASTRQRALVPVAIVAVLAGMTIRRNQVWASPVRLWQDSAQKSP